MSSRQGGAGAKAARATAATEPLLAFADGVLAQGQNPAAGVPAEICQYVSFFLRDEEYAIPILQCREIVRISSITRVPEAPDHVRGVVNLRGRIVPAVDTRKRLGLESAPLTARSRLIVVEVAGRLFALIVDRVARILKVDAVTVESLPADQARPGATTLARVDEAVVLLMDPDRVLRDGAAVSSTTKGEGA
jgi:purine-binding chemotaxis protein CheW